MIQNPGHSSSFICHFLLLVLSLFCFNVLILSAVGHYDVRIGFVHLSAHGLFKPVLMMNSWFLLALMVCGALAPKRGWTELGAPEGWRLARNQSIIGGLISLVVLLVYFNSAQVNLLHYDWTHRHISAGLNSFSSLLHLFAAPQADGFYRPLTFVSLWADYRLFGSWYPGYHWQSIALHIVNSLLVVRLAGRLRFESTQSLWAGLLYSVAAVHFEPVLWPAARFDLLATGFTLGALILAVRYFSSRANWRWELPTSLFCFVLAVMNKESGYCFPLLILFFLCTHRIWSIPRPGTGKTIFYSSLMAAVSVIMVLIRIAVYGNFGGYSASAALESPHFALGWKTLASLLRVLPLSIFGVNTTSAAPVWVPAVLVFFVVFILGTAIACRGCFGRREFSLVVCTFLASIPVLNISGWIGSSMQHDRYLYMPAIFSVLLLVSLIGGVRRGGLLLGLCVVVNAGAAVANIQVYRNMLQRVGAIADSVRLDWIAQPGLTTIYLLDLPEHAGGVFYSGSELVERIESKIPNAAVVRLESRDPLGEADACLVYRWNNEDRTLRLISKQAISLCSDNNLRDREQPSPSSGCQP